MYCGKGVMRSHIMYIMQNNAGMSILWMCTGSLGHKCVHAQKHLFMSYKYTLKYLHNIVFNIWH